MMNRRTVARLVAATEPPRYRRAPTGSMLDPLEPVMRAVLADWPAIKAPALSPRVGSAGRESRYSSLPPPVPARGNRKVRWVRRTAKSSGELPAFEPRVGP